MESESNYNPDKERPKILYHATENSDLEKISALQRSYRDEQEGPKVFATPELQTAAFFISRKVKESGRFGETPYAVIVGDRDEFIETDQGGTVYEFSSEGFITDPQKGLGESEWTNDQDVIPNNKTVYPSSLQFMLDQGVQVYFVSPDQYKNIKDSDDHGLEILQSLKSENELKSINFRSLKDYVESDAE